MGRPVEKKSQLWKVVLLVSGLIMVISYLAGERLAPELAYSDFKAKLAAGQVERVNVSPTRITGTLKPDGAAKEHGFRTIRVSDEHLLEQLDQRGVHVTGIQDTSSLTSVLVWLLPLGFVVFGSWLLARGAGRAGQGYLAVGNSKAKIYMEKEVKVSFADAAGVDEAKEELQEVVEFLRTPAKFARLGGTLPKGILLVGPPGTGKTLLARAVAGEAGVPFFSISGSEFVEMFVGVGAARVRDLFAQARPMAPCIIFIDELDALGKVRGFGPAAHEEREQTLNQLLVELDGFDPREGVILMAATNRPEILDPALLRAGRFDRHVLVDRPDKRGRLAILELHARKVALAPGTELELIAAMTAGLVGADLANLVNEAALLAVRRNRETVGMAELQEAVERVVAGLEKRNRVLTRAEKERVAHHEIGHALMALALPGHDVVQKISIVPRGIAALGYTLQRPTEDRFLMTKGELLAKLATLLGGRVAEELVYEEVSTGAQDDLLKAAELARSMVTSYGMSASLGPLSFDRGHPPLLADPGDALPRRGDYSEETSRQIDSEVKRIVEQQHAHATQVLRGQLPLLREAAALLIARETLSGEELQALIDRRANPAAA
jgi:cell division protease FtsH